MNYKFISKNIKKDYNKGFYLDDYTPEQAFVYHYGGGGDCVKDYRENHPEEWNMLAVITGGNL